MSSYRLQPATDRRWWWSLFGVTAVVLLLPAALLPLVPTRAVSSDVRLGMTGYSWSIPLDLSCSPGSDLLVEGWTCGSVSLQTMIVEGGADPDRTLRRMMRAASSGLAPTGAEILREGDARMLIDAPTASVGMSLEGLGEQEGLTMIAVLTGPGEQVVPLADLVWEKFTGQGLPEIVREAIVTPTFEGDGWIPIPFEPLEMTKVSV